MDKVNPLTPELNPTAQRCLPRFFYRDFNFKGFIARRLYKSFGVKGLTPLGVKGLMSELNPSAQRCLPRFFTGDFNF
jgi:hypothetical protein